MPKINIMQLLCPRRHAIAGLAYDQAKTTRREARTLLVQGLKAMQANPQCGICGSVDLKFEVGRTKFSTLAEAGKALIEEERKNLQARSVIDGIRRAARNN